MKLTNLAACTVALMIGGGQALALDLTKLCGDFQVLANPDTKVYRGKWTSGEDGSTHESALAVTEVTDSGRALVFYVWGKKSAWRINKAGCDPKIGTMKGDTLTIKDWATRTYEFGEDGTVSAVFKSKRHKNRGKFKLAE